MPRARINSSTLNQANSTLDYLALFTIRILRLAKAPIKDLEDALTIHLSNAFKKLHPLESRLSLYLYLEEKTSPEALTEFLDDESLAYLKQINGLHSAQKILASFNIKPSRMKEFLAYPIPFINYALKLNIEANRIETSIHITEEDIAKRNIIYKQLASLPTGLVQIHKLNNNLERYFEPLKILSKLIKTIIALPPYAFILLVYQLKDLTRYFVIEKALGGLLNLISGDNLAAATEHHRENHFEQTKKGLLDYYRLREEHLLVLNDEQLIAFQRQTALMDPEQYEKDLNAEINTRLAPRGWESIKLAAVAIYDKLREPLPPTTVAIIKAVTTWPLRFTAAIPALLVAGLLEGIDRLGHLTILIGTAAVSLFTAGILLVLNTPLIIWDAPGFIIYQN